MIIRAEHLIILTADHADTCIRAHLWKSVFIRAGGERLSHSFFKLPFMSELIQLKVALGEQAQLSANEIKTHAEHIERLHRRLVEERDRSNLPQNITDTRPLNELLIRLRD